MRVTKQMWRGALGLLVIVLVGACGNNRQGQWPAVVAGYQNFSSEQQQAVSAALEKLNLNATIAMTNAGASSSGYPIYFVLSPPNTSAENRAGLATIASDKCTIQLSTEVFAPEKKGYVEPVVWHEIGHCAGLMHVSDSTEIMYFATQPMEDYSQDSLSRFFQSIRSSAGL